MDQKTAKRDEKALYYVQPNAQANPQVDLFCANSKCVNFIPVHQTCNLKSILINEKGKCQFFAKRKAKRK